MSDSQQDITQLRLTLQEAQEKMQSLRTKFYAHKRQPVPLLQADEPIQPGQSDESIKLQEALNQTYKVIRIYEGELERTTNSSHQPNRVHQPLTTGQQRGCLLTGWLILGGFNNGLHLFLLPISGVSFFKATIVVIILTFSFIGINALWNLQRWGYFLMASLYLMSILMQFIFVAIGGNYFVAAFGLVLDTFNLVILSLVVLLRWKHLE